MKRVIITCHGGVRLDTTFLDIVQDKFPQMFEDGMFIYYTSNWKTNQEFIDELLKFPLPLLEKGAIEIIEYDPKYKLVVSEYDGFESCCLDLPYEQIIEDLVSYIKDPNIVPSFFVQKLLHGESLHSLSYEASLKELYAT